MGIFDRKKKILDKDSKSAAQSADTGEVHVEILGEPKGGIPNTDFSDQQTAPEASSYNAEQQPPMQQGQGLQEQPSQPSSPKPDDTALQNLGQSIAASQQDLQSMMQKTNELQQQEYPYKPGLSPDLLPTKKPSRLKLYLEGVGAKKKGLENALRNQGIKTSLYEFVRNMFIAALALGIVLGGTLFILFQIISLALPQTIVFSALIGALSFYMAFQTFLNFPTQRGKVSAKSIERDILFAARDMIISLRSGMPLFNAITSISSGYGEASKEFAKIVEKVQLGTSLEDAIDQTVSESKSVSFRRIMLQAAVSIRAGADVVSALQSVIDQLAQERIIELRRYGQRLNAIAMFYMLFGIIMPSMGIAVVTILTTFIAIFTVNATVLEFALVGIIFLQIVFLKMITSSRPVFTM